MNDTKTRARSLWGLLVVLAGYHPVVELSLGSIDGGAAAAGGGTSAADDGGAGGGAATDGDATCDQSQCLPATAVLRREGISQLVLGGPDSVVAMGPMYSETLSLGQLDLATGTATHLRGDHSNPLDVSAPLRVQSGHVYLLTTWAGELWGIPARVRLADGAMEELLSNAPSNGNPVERAHDVDATDYVFSAGGELLRLSLSTIPGVASAFVTLASGERVADLRLGATHVWWVTQTGLYRAARAGGPPELMQAGAFTRVKLAGDEVWVCGAGGLARWTSTGFTTLTTTAVDDFALARGAWFIAVRSGTVAQVRDSGGAVVLEDADPTAGRALSLEVTDARIVLGTGSRLLVKSAVPPVSACGCAAPTLTLPTAVAACERSFCGGGQRSEGLSGGAFVGDALFGVFHEAQSFDPKLKRVNATSSAGSAVVFDLLSTQPSVVGDATSVFAIASGGLWAIDVASGTSRNVLADTWTPSRWQTPAAPMLALDPTHVYVVDSLRGVGRVERAGGEWQQLLPGSLFVDGIRLDATHLYVSKNGELLRVPKGGGAVEVLARGLEGEAGFDLAEGHAYFLTARGLERVRVGGGFKSLVLSHEDLGVTRASHLNLQGRDLVFVSFRAGDADYRLERLELVTRTRETLVSMPTASSLRGVIVTAEGVALGGYDSSSYRARGCCP